MIDHPYTSILASRLTRHLRTKWFGAAGSKVDARLLIAFY